MWNANFKEERGSTFVETVLTLPVFLFLTLGTVELLIMSYQAIATQFLVARAVRYAVLGNPPVAPATTRQDDIKAMLTNLSAQFAINLDPANIEVCSGDSQNCSDPKAGQSNDLISIRITRHPVNVFYISPVPLSVSAVAVGRNEPSSS